MTYQYFWGIEAPHGQMSKGRCKKCGAVQMFSNSLPSPRATGFVPDSPTIGKRGKRKQEAKV